MKIIINTTNLFQGGGLQVAYSFLKESIKFKENEYHVLLCAKLKNQLCIDNFPKNYFFYDFPNRPSLSRKGRKVIKRLQILEKKINPDCVFSVFGPTYWTPNSPHLMRFAIAHFIYPHSDFHKQISWVERKKWTVLKKIKKYFFLKNADYYHVETNDAKVGLAKFLSVPAEKIFVVSNTYNSTFDIPVTVKQAKLPLKKNDEFRFVTVTGYYRHKNLEILNKVIPLLQEKKINVKFVLTLKDEDFKRVFNEDVQSSIINIGPIPITECPQLYNECDAVFLPTLLECFSANYPEAMKMGKPILTSNLSFAKDICKDAALYFNPLDENEVSNMIALFLRDKELQNNLIEKGKIRLAAFPSASERARKFIELCNLISKQ